MSRLSALLWVMLSIVQADAQTPETTFEADAAGYRSRVRPFLEKYCSACHNAEVSEGNLVLDRDLTLNFLDPTAQAKWGEVVNVLNSHEMPPKDEPQPEPSETAAVVDWTTTQVVAAQLHRRDHHIVLRRLNRAEYRNVIRDLVGIEVDAKHFPQDPTAGGFDNNGGALNLSPMQMELYYDEALKILNKALVTGDQPESFVWRIEPDSGNSDANRVDFQGQRPIVNGGQNAVRDGCVVLHHDNWDRKVNTRDFRLKHPGKYQIRIRAGGRVPDREQVVASAEKFLRERRDRELQENPKGKRYIEEAYERALQHFRTDRMYDYGPPRIKVIRDLAGQPEVIAELDIDASYRDMKDLVIETDFTTESAGITIEYAYAIPRELENFWFQTGDAFERPECWIDWIELSGPVYEAWPPASHRKILLDDSFHATNDRAHAEKVLRRFMALAYRRTVTPEEVEEKLKLFDAASGQSQSFIDAIQVPLAAVMVSPSFLYLVESTPTGEPLNDFELASRLSFFLWSSMPDPELLRLAQQQTLRQPDVLRAQVDRMVKDGRIGAFVQNFAGQWLGLRDVGANPPAADLFRHYDRHLETSMVRESEAFFREILDHDLDVMNFVDSDFVVINERMARFYGIDGVRGDHFRRVSISPEIPRGGVMTHASILTTTSNGTRTSPVKRGTWILKNILGTDPGLPVANAGEIAPKVPGIDKATVRKRLEIHRELPQCARCHDKIDPLGFALENFDASGFYRKQEGFGYQGRIERDDPVIDATSQLPDGTKIDGIHGLQRELLKKEELFLACLTSKMMTYALGRELTLADRPAVQQTVQLLQRSDRSLRSLIHTIVSSKSFTHR
ncbi:MAG: DUF1592 domain-containing protein [Pirellula sp.]|nr:DUF1592 domain-containing protein [Pirellula sp.]